MIKLKDLLTEASLSEEMRELKLFIDNDASLYRQRYMPILKNLSKKKKKGNYRKRLAQKACEVLWWKSFRCFPKTTKKRFSKRLC